jgi:Helix-turn-helix domain
MAKLTKVEAARQLGISRTTLYKLIDQGKLSATPDGMVDETELVRVAPYVDTLREHTRTRGDTLGTSDMDMLPGDDGHGNRVHEHDHEHVRTRVHEQAWTGMDTLVDILREQLQRAQERERAYEERERAMQDHIAQLTAMLQEAHQQNQRLLDMPRSTSAPSPPPSPAGPTAEPRGAMRRRIVALLREYPEGLTPAEIRSLLGVDRPLGDTLLGMRRDGLVQRVGHGRYVVAIPVPEAAR